MVTRYGSVRVSPDLRLRTLLSRPTAADGALHPLLFTQWVSCGTIEIRSPVPDIVLKRLAQSSGPGFDSRRACRDGGQRGPGCDALDYDSEVRHYVSAFSQLLEHPWVDASRVFVFGSSLGSTTAPLVARALQAKGVDIAGVAVQGGGALTYYERMLNFDRYYLQRRPEAVPPQDIDEQMRRRALFHAEYLLKGRLPAQIARMVRRWQRWRRTFAA